MGICQAFWLRLAPALVERVTGIEPAHRDGFPSGSEDLRAAVTPHPQCEASIGLGVLLPLWSYEITWFHPPPWVYHPTTASLCGAAHAGVAQAACGGERWQLALAAASGGPAR